MHEIKTNMPFRWKIPIEIQDVSIFQHFFSAKNFYILSLFFLIILSWQTFLRVGIQASVPPKRHFRIPSGMLRIVHHMSLFRVDRRAH